MVHLSSTQYTENSKKVLKRQQRENYLTGLRNVITATI